MKKLFCLIALFLPLLAISQYIVKIDNEEYRTDTVGRKKFENIITKLEIKKVKKQNPAKEYFLVSGDEEKKFKTDGEFHSLEFLADIRGTTLSILDEARNDSGLFLLEKDPGTTRARNETDPRNGGSMKIVLPKSKTATAYILSELYTELKDVEGQGLKIPGPDNPVEFTGPDYIHLFFDQNGNSLIRSIPVGIANAKYVVHVIYLVPADNPDVVDYKVNQSPADIEEGVVIRGDGGLSDALRLDSRPNQLAIKFAWRHYKIALTPSSYDVRFEIVRSGFEIVDGNLEMKAPVVVTSRLIRMKRIYHGSIDVGLLRSDVEDPTFALTPSDLNPDQSVVKKTDEGSRVMASAMYTFYLSPIVLLQKLISPQKVQNYRIEGRNFADDHRIYERIYPAVGIGLNDRLLNNIFAGGKWEFIRGGSLFVGQHWSKVNVLEVDGDFKFGETIISKESFDLKTKTKWKGGFCIGLNLDVRIVTNLFQRNNSDAVE